jgi:hypothetical protein
VLSIRAVGAALVLQRSPLFSEAYQGAQSAPSPVSHGIPLACRAWDTEVGGQLLDSASIRLHPANLKRATDSEAHELPSDNSPVGPRHETSLHTCLELVSARGFPRRGRAFKNFGWVQSDRCTIQQLTSNFTIPRGVVSHAKRAPGRG